MTRPETYAAAMAELDQAIAERDELRALFAAESESRQIARALAALIDLCHHRVGDGETRDIIVNLTGIYRYAMAVNLAQATEIEHWARAAQDAEDEHAELLVQCDELRAELADARSTVPGIEDWHGRAAVTG